jgi:hypothetical protein
MFVNEVADCVFDSFDEDKPKKAMDFIPQILKPVDVVKERLRGAFPFYLNQMIL